MLAKDGAFASGWKGLDYGAGFGRIGSLLLSKGTPDQLDLADAWTKSIDYLKRGRFQNRIIEVPEILSADDLRANAYDLIFSFSVFTHLSPDVFWQNLSVLFKALKPGGKLYITLRHGDFVRANYANIAEKVERELASSGCWFHPTKGNLGKAAVFGESVVTEAHFRERAARELGSVRYLGKLPGQMQHLYSVTCEAANTVVPERYHPLMPRATHAALASMIEKGFDIGIGAYTYGAPTVRWSPAQKQRYRLSIGKFCAIAEGVTIYVGTQGRHPTDFLSSYPIGMIFGPFQGPFERSGAHEGDLSVKIGNDVWIGRNAQIMSGVTVADGAVIGAGAIVTDDVPPYAIALGAPARPDRYRFSDDQIRKLIQLKWWDYPDAILRKHLDLFRTKNIDRAIEVLSREVAERRDQSSDAHE